MTRALVRPDVRSLNIDLNSGIGSEFRDLAGLDLANFDSVDMLSEQRQPDRISAFARAKIERLPRRLRGWSGGVLGEQPKRQSQPV